VNRIVRLLAVLATFFVICAVLLFPEWEIEHPADRLLIINTEHHALWNRPPHSHLNGIDLLLNVSITLLFSTGIVALTRRAATP